MVNWVVMFLQGMVLMVDMEEQPIGSEGGFCNDRY
jgi:hypothetical protein